jgi:hypothetical protein
MMSFVICPLDQLLLELLNRNDEIGGTCRTSVEMR